MGEKMKDWIFIYFFTICLGLLMFVPGCIIGERRGYIAALDDIRQGNTPKYKAVQVGEKWVENDK